jgi:hypothetical protein
VIIRRRAYFVRASARPPHRTLHTAHCPLTYGAMVIVTKLLFSVVPRVI